VGLGIASIGIVPNSILLGRWFGPRLPTAMAVVYSATGAGVLLMLPISQLLIDHLGWRGAYQVFGGVVCCWCRRCHDFTGSYDALLIYALVNVILGMIPFLAMSALR
jgi:MFS family permease